MKIIITTSILLFCAIFSFSQEDYSNTKYYISFCFDSHYCTDTLLSSVKIKELTNSFNINIAIKSLPLYKANNFISDNEIVAHFLDFISVINLCNSGEYKCKNEINSLDLIFGNDFLFDKSYNTSIAGYKLKIKNLSRIDFSKINVTFSKRLFSRKHALKINERIKIIGTEKLIRDYLKMRYFNFLVEKKMLSNDNINLLPKVK